MMIKAQVGEKSYEIVQEQDQFTIDGQPFKFDVAQTASNDFHFLINHKSYQAKVLSIDRQAKTVEVKINQTPYTISIKDHLDILLAKLGMESVGASGDKDVKAPMPGLILDVLVDQGQEVKKGDHLLILEAMKMENVIKSPSDGVVTELMAVKGDSVEKGKILLSL